MSFMGFVKDMMSGGGNLNRHIVPREIRTAAPKELQPGGFDPARDWLGYDINANPAKDARIKDQQLTAAAQAAYSQGAQPLRGSQMGMAGPQQIQGLLAASQFQPVGPYGQQAQQLAGQQPYGMPQQPAYGAPNAGSTTIPPGMPYDNTKRFRLIPGGNYK